MQRANLRAKKDPTNAFWDGERTTKYSARTYKIKVRTRPRGNEGVFETHKSRAVRFNAGEKIGLGVICKGKVSDGRGKRKS